MSHPNTQNPNASQQGSNEPNRLIQANSPYLLQHAHNPVDWHPWGEEALTKAKAENKPIFLSIGYAACHWCHVMEHEVFEMDELTADPQGGACVGEMSALDPAPPDDRPFGHPGRSASVWRDGAMIGWVGHLHPGLAKALDLDGEVVGFELDLAAVAARAVPRAGELSRFPSVRRDIALVVPDPTPWSALEASLRAALGPVLREVVLFDRYVGPGLEPGSKSLAMGLILQDVSRTLTDRDADQAVATALEALAKDCGARLRS